MNKREAQSAGLYYTGMSERTYRNETVKAEAKRIRKLGFRAVVVNEENFSSLYVAKDYVVAERDYKRWMSAERGIQNAEATIAKLRAQIEEAETEIRAHEMTLATPKPPKVDRY